MPAKHKVVGQYRVQLEPELGHGAYGTVHLSRHLITHELRAIKALRHIDCLNISKEMKVTAKRYLDTEIKAMREIKSEHIVRLYDVISTKRRMYLVMEYCDGKSLKERLRDLSFDQAAEYFRQLASALVAIHARRLVHRDLKPENVLLHKNSLKLADFGLAKEVTERTLLRTLVGTKLYMAPEVLRLAVDQANGRLPYNERADYWSAGVILYQMVSGKVLFQSKTEIELIQEQKTVCEDPRIIDALNVSLDCKNLLKQMIVENPAQRISSEDFKQHPFVTGVPRLSRIDFYSLLSFSQPPLYTVVHSVALRLATLLCSWAEESKDAFVFYVKACQVLSSHVDRKTECLELFCKTLKQAETAKPMVLHMSGTLVLAERVAVLCTEVRKSGLEPGTQIKRLREAALVLELAKQYPQIVAFKRRIEKMIEKLG